MNRNLSVPSSKPAARTGGPLANRWLVIGLLIIAALVLAGCGVPREGVDVATHDPSGPWQTIVVWPLAKALIWLDSFLRGANIPYHWGFAIVLFTLGIKLVTFPLTVKQIQGMQAQKNLQPKIQELQKKYGKDRERLSQEQMKLYKEAGVNPLSGCLPLVVQMPILFGLYSALISIGPSLKDSRFFWIPDLGFPNHAQTNSSPQWILDWFGQGRYLELAAYLVLPVLLMVTQFIMQKWMTPAPTGDQNQMAGMTQQIGLMMTLMFGFFTLTVPAGLTLYWVTSNALQMLQQWITTDSRFGLAPKPLALATSAGTISTNGSGSKGETKVIDGSANPVAVAAGDADDDSKTEKSREIRRRRSKRR